MPERRPGGGDPVEILVRFAGRREAVPEERAARVERSLHAHWQQLVATRRAERRRNRLALWGAGVAAAAGVLLAVMFLPPMLSAPTWIANVVLIEGGAHAGARGAPLAPLSAGDALSTGTVLETAEQGGASLALASGHSLRVAGDSRLRLERLSIVLDRGALYLDSGTDVVSTPITVHSSLGSVRELGTQYAVYLGEDSLQVQVREGAVHVSRASGEVLAARAGEALEIARNGSTRRESIPAYGPHWQWVLELGPPFELEGRTLAEFLEWLAREQGWRLVYANDALQPSAESIELHGSIAGLEPEDALASVTGTTSVTYVLEQGTLRIEPRRPVRR